MAKPATIDLYNDAVTEDCERLLVTLLRHLGPWKNSIFLVGGLVPRYLVKARPPKVAKHAGSGDVDVVVDLQVLASTDAYQTLEDNLKRMGFDRAENSSGKKVSWRWQKRVASGMLVLEFLADDPTVKGGKIQELPAKGKVSALNIPNASIVFDHNASHTVTVELLDEAGKATETIRYADIVSHTCLKAFAFDQRFERKDAHDLLYCVEHIEGGFEFAASELKSALAGKHAKAIQMALTILKTRFCGDSGGEGFRKDGPVAVARFELGESDEPEIREQRILRQRQTADIVTNLLAAIDGKNKDGLA